MVDLVLFKKISAVSYNDFGLIGNMYLCKVECTKSLMSLIPNNCQEFYNKFSDSTVKDDTDGFDGALIFKYRLMIFKIFSLKHLLLFLLLLHITVVNHRDLSMLLKMLTV